MIQNKKSGTNVSHILEQAHDYRKAEEHEKAYKLYKLALRRLKKGSWFRKLEAEQHYQLATAYKFVSSVDKSIHHFRMAHGMAPKKIKYIIAYLTELQAMGKCNTKQLLRYFPRFMAINITDQKSHSFVQRYYLLLRMGGCVEEAVKIREKLGDRFEKNDNIIAHLYDDITKSPEFKALDRFDEFSEYIRINADSLCIVGNSGCEKGKGNGEKIDSHHAIIRFNNFSTSSEYANDYGQRTTVWVRGGNKKVAERSEQFEFIAYTIPNIFFHPHNWEEIRKYIKQGRKLCLIPARFNHELAKILGAQPSSGLLMLYVVYKILGRNLNREDIYGFAFTDHIHNRKSAHYFENFKVSMGHAWSKEKRLFNVIVK